MKLLICSVVAYLAGFCSANPIADPGNGESRHGFTGHMPTHTSGQCQPTGSPDHAHNTSASNQPTYTFDELWNMQKTFLDNFIYPGNVKQAQSINSTLFAPNIKGRVDVTRTFEGPELNTEYLFGLFTNIALNPDAITLLGVPVAYDIVHFAASQNIASAGTIIYFDFPAINATVPIEIDTWNMWDVNGQLVQYDVTFKWFQYLFDALIQAAMPIFKATTPAQMIAIFTKLIATGICKTHTTYCTGANQQYINEAACLDFITTKIRFGAAYELGANTLVCRMVHENMVYLRPEVHCPHIGPTGGGMCVDDYTYVKKVLQPYFTNAPFVPWGYQSANATVAAM